MEEVGQEEVSAVEGSPSGDDSGAGFEELTLFRKGNSLDLAARRNSLTFTSVQLNL